MISKGSFESSLMEVTENDVQVVSDQYLGEVNIILDDVLRMKIGDPLHNFEGPSKACFERNFGMLEKVGDQVTSGFGKALNLVCKRIIAMIRNDAWMIAKKFVDIPL